jgi:DNA-binding CsgD family transcriptional regulator
VRSTCSVTDREAEILRWIRDGKTNDDIAEILEVSPYTVKNHIQKILRKMGVENRSHAVARAISLGILGSAEA